MNQRKTYKRSSTCPNVDAKISASSKDLQNSNSDANKSSQAILHGTDNIFNINYVERELECQICLSPLESPILLACNSHSLCLSCLTSLYEHQAKQKDGSRSIFCPSCGVLSGIMKVKKLENLKINRELERVQKAYDKEKGLWVEEKLKLEADLYSLKNNKGQEKDMRGDEGKKKASKKGLSSEEEINLRQLLEDFGSEKLHEASQLILDILEAKEKSTPVVQRRSTRKTKDNTDDKDESVTTAASEKESTRKRSPSQKGILAYVEKIAKPKMGSAIKRKTTETAQILEKREYPLRDLKRTKTTPL